MAHMENKEKMGYSMRNLFYLPDGITVAKAKDLWRQQATLGDSQVHSSSIEDPADDVKESHKSLREILSEVKHHTTIILWSVYQIDFPIEEFSSLLMAQRNQAVVVRILNPNVVMDPKEPKWSLARNSQSL
jgi:hypothetical protein